MDSLHEKKDDKENEENNHEQEDEIVDLKHSFSLEECESSICVGNDMTINGEKEVNGFSAKGWSPFMATMAMNRAVDTMQ